MIGSENRHSKQPVLAQAQTRITQVQVEATADGGLTITLNAGFELPSGQQTPLNETTLAIDLPNTQLNLVGGEQFISNNPTPDIAAVRVFPLDDRTVRVEVVGKDGQPDVSLEQAPTGLIVTVLPEPIQEFTIISTRHPTPVAETPASVETVTEEELNQRRALIRNTGDAIQTIPGVTLNHLGYKLSPQWSIEGNLGIVDSEDESGQPLSQLEDFPTTALVRLLYQGDRFSSFLQTRIYDDQGEVLLTDGIVGEGTEGAVAVDLGLGYKLTPTQELTLSVENLFDTDYFYSDS